MGPKIAFSPDQLTWDLDFFFWGYVMQHIYRLKPSSIDDLKMIVQEFIQSIDPTIIKKACASTKERFQMLRIENGGRFEHKKNALKLLCNFLFVIL